MQAQRFIRRLGASALISSMALANVAMAQGQSASDSLDTVIHKIRQSQTITQADAAQLQGAAESDVLRERLPAREYQRFAAQADRYNLEGVAAALRSYAAAQPQTPVSLRTSPEDLVDDDYEDDFIANIDHYSNQMDGARREGTELIVIEKDGNLLRMDDPIAGHNLEAVGLSCFYHSTSLASQTPPRRYGLDMMLFDEPQMTAILHSSGKREDWYVTPYEITRLAVDWETVSTSITAYLYGRKAERDEQRPGDTGGVSRPQPKWHRYTCPTKNVRYERPIYAPHVSAGWAVGNGAPIAPRSAQ